MAEIEKLKKENRELNNLLDQKGKANLRLQEENGFLKHDLPRLEKQNKDLVKDNKRLVGLVNKLNKRSRRYKSALIQALLDLNEMEGGENV